MIEELRAQSWVVRSRYGYTVLSFAEAMEIKKSARFVRIFDAVRPDESEYLFDKANKSVSAQSGPTLVRMRRALLRALRPRTVGGLRPQMGSIFNDLLDNLNALGSPDVVRDAVERYPGLVMSPILGVPFAETRELDRWASTINILGNHPEYATRLGDVERAYRNMEAYLLNIIADRRAHPSTDVLGELIASANTDPEISDDELLMLAHAIVNASIDNVRSQLALTVEALVRHPHQWRALQGGPGSRRRSYRRRPEVLTGRRRHPAPGTGGDSHEGPGVPCRGSCVHQQEGRQPGPWRDGRPSRVPAGPRILAALDIRVRAALVRGRRACSSRHLRSRGRFANASCRGSW